MNHEVAEDFSTIALEFLKEYSLGLGLAGGVEFIEVKVDKNKVAKNQQIFARPDHMGTATITNPRRSTSGPSLASPQSTTQQELTAVHFATISPQRSYSLSLFSWTSC